jgi:hypothetical protein
MTIDPNLWASLARQYSGGVTLPVTGQAGFIAVVNTDENNLDFVTPRGLLRELYDATITASAANVPSDGGEGWVVLVTWSLAALLPTDLRLRTIRLELNVADATSGVVSPIIVTGAVRRDDGSGDLVYQLDDGSSDAAGVAWALPLFGAAGTFGLRFGLSGDVLTLEAQAHATSDRTVTGEIYLGVIRA